MNRDDFKELSETMKTDKVNQKSQSHKLDFYFYSETDRKAETYRTAEQDRITLNNFLFNFFKDKS